MVGLLISLSNASPLPALRVFPLIASYVSFVVQGLNSAWLPLLRLFLPGFKRIFK
jgi:hypothetical protein